MNYFYPYLLGNIILGTYFIATRDTMASANDTASEEMKKKREMWGNSTQMLMDRVHNARYYIIYGLINYHTRRQLRAN